MSAASPHRGSSPGPHCSYFKLDAFDLMVELLGDDVGEAELQEAPTSSGW